MVVVEGESFAKVVCWLKADEVERKDALDWLPPPVHFSLIPSRLQAMYEALLSRHSLFGKLMAKCLPKFAASEQATCCLRLKARVGRWGGISFELVMILDGHWFR